MLSSLPLTLASIPSPSFNVFHLGPLTLRMYGLCIAAGVIAAVVISSKRWEARGGDPDDIGTIALWAVPAGVIGARMYHVATDWKTYRGNWGQAFNITNGGLGIPGGVLLGVLAGLWVVKRKGLPALPLLDVVAPAIPVAQAIGRLGNWFNQELFGRATTLPWGLRIDAAHLPPGYDVGTLFHPTFLYEALWNLSLAGLLIWIDRKGKLRPGELFTLYVLGYSIGRLWVEELRIDHASLVLGVRVNVWMSVIVAVVSVIVFARNRRNPNPSDGGMAAYLERRTAAAEGVATSDAPDGTEPTADSDDSGDADDSGDVNAPVRSPYPTVDADAPDDEDDSAGV